MICNINHFYSIDILPILKTAGFLDTNVWNPGISTAEITHTLQFGNALPSFMYKYIKKMDMFVHKKNRISKTFPSHA